MAEMDKQFKALRVKEEEGRFVLKPELCSVGDLPPGEVLVRVVYSGLNYKDALSSSGNRGVTRVYPHTPGIDAAGYVETSEDPGFKTGDPVLVTGYDLGMNTAGGWGEYIRVPAGWVLPLPKGLTLKESMILGTAGFTAGMSVFRLAELVPPGSGTILVSGATGGVGSMSLALLSLLGYKTAGVTGKPDQKEYLESLGVQEILTPGELTAQPERPLLKPRFAGGIDAVGGPVLESMLKSIQPLGAVTCCGNAASANLNMTVFPFILRGITLVGIDSQNCPREHRRMIWNRLAGEWKIDNLKALVKEVSPDGLTQAVEEILGGKLKGRVLVRHGEPE